MLDRSRAPPLLVREGSGVEAARRRAADAQAPPAATAARDGAGIAVRCGRDGRGGRGGRRASPVILSVSEGSVWADSAPTRSRAARPHRFLAHARNDIVALTRP